MKSDATGGAELRKECERLRAENARLVSLLEKHGNPWEPAHPTTILRDTPARYPSFAEAAPRARVQPFCQ